MIKIVVASDIACKRRERFIHEGIDLEFAKSEQICDWLGGGEIVSDGTEEGDAEISVGRVKRDYAEEFLASLKFNEYGVCRKGGNTIVAGHCTATTALAADYLLSLDKEELKDGFVMVFAYDGFEADFPEFSGRIVSATDCCFGNFEVVYEAKREEYDGYVSALPEKGYTLGFENEICGNVFKRFKNDKTFLTVSYFPVEGYVRIICGSLEKNEFIDVLSSEEGEISDVTVTQMTLDYISGSFGMCYIITLRDGSFVIFDGGYVRVKDGYPKTYDYVRLYTLLNELNKRPDGKIVISAWLMTHEHSDHFNVFYWFCKQYGSEVTLKAYCACPCSAAVAYNAQNPEFHTANGRLAEALENVGCDKIVTLQIGDKFTLGGVTFEIIFTIDSLWPKRLRLFNDCSVVSKMTYCGQSVMWLGDAGIEPSKRIRAIYTPEYLKCDIVNVAHHGYNGIESELYDIIDAKVYLWSLYDKHVKNFLSEEADRKFEYIRYAQRILTSENPPEIFYHTGSNYTLRLPYRGEEDLTKR